MKLAQTLAKLQGFEIKTKELVDEWILITYDIPVTEAGKIARSKFLNAAPRIGAMMHSRSVYLMPNTKQAQLAALDLSKTVGGDVFIWTSRMEGDKALDITAFYDNRINEEIQDIEDRMEKEALLIKEEKFGMADRMHRKTANLFNQILFASAQRGVTPDVIQKLTTIECKLYGGRKGE